MASPEEIVDPNEKIDIRLTNVRLVTIYPSLVFHQKLDASLELPQVNIFSRVYEGVDPKFDIRKYEDIRSIHGVSRTVVFTEYYVQGEEIDESSSEVIVSRDERQWICYDDRNQTTKELNDPLLAPLSGLAKVTAPIKEIGTSVVDVGADGTELAIKIPGFNPYRLSGYTHNLLIETIDVMSGERLTKRVKLDLQTDEPGPSGTKYRKLDGGKGEASGLSGVDISLATVAENPRSQVSTVDQVISAVSYDGVGLSNSDYTGIESFSSEPSVAADPVPDLQSVFGPEVLASDYAPATVDPFVLTGPSSQVDNDISEFDTIIRTSAEFIANPLTIEEVEEFFRLTE